MAVTTRQRSARKKQKEESPPPAQEREVEEESDVDHAAANDDPQNDDDNHEKRPTPSSSRRKHREELRSKSTGVGISVTASAPHSKKITFGDDEEIAVVEREDDAPAAEESVVENEDSDDDDDAVEEIRGSTAKDLAQEQLERERAIATVRAALTKKSRKRKNKTQDVMGDDFDDDFFKQLEVERKEERQQRKKNSKQQFEPKGRHTTFVISGDQEGEDGVASYITSKELEHNIEVVVLEAFKDDASNDPNASYMGRNLMLQANKEPPSEAVLMYSRCGLIADGSEAPSSKQLQKAKKAGHKTVQAPTWTRSKKMTRILAAGKRRKGKAAAHFVVKM